MDNTYEGWKNYETWAVHMLLSGERKNHDRLVPLVRQTKKRDLRQRLRFMVEDMVPRVMPRSPTMWHDLAKDEPLTFAQDVRASLLKVNWTELAEHYTAEYKDEPCLTKESSSSATRKPRKR